ncbi:S1 family peptidase [Vibrio gazogenes]|uniref:Peptidase S1 domain-containing protein n=1 Tax=Vibrio gazogenes TaxID=687 RepID=A0A1Z2SEG8_VIBGA|nr:serine protease [Vibrio gazogenes]ASA55507.1 hypothetical protein BSQ33_07195 [Vibrio gazogenes]
MKKCFISALSFISPVLCLLLITPLSAQANTGFAPRIINGTTATLGDWPFMTAIVAKGRSASNGQFCGGSFIGERYVLTASHCVEGKSANELDVIIGINDLNNESTEGQRVSVQSIYMHEDYNSSTITNDIAILELSNTVTAIPVVLATTTLVDSLSGNGTTGDTVTAMGWGNTSTTSNAFPSVLNEVNLLYVDRSTCQNLGGDYSFVGNDAICAGFQTGGKDSCQGDSGGPLIYNDGGTNKQIGIVSWGNGCAQPNAYGVYANVGYFKNNHWITQKTSGVSYTQKAYITTSSGTVTQTFAIRNYSTESFDITHILPPSGVTLINNGCTTTLNQNDSCSLTFAADAAQLYQSRTKTITIDTDHSVSSELKIFFVSKVPVVVSSSSETPPEAPPETPSGKSGGASLLLCFVAIIGFMFRRQKGLSK